MIESADRYRRMADWLEDFTIRHTSDEDCRSQAIAAANALRRAAPWLAVVVDRDVKIEGVESAGTV